VQETAIVTTERLH